MTSFAYRGFIIRTSGIGNGYAVTEEDRVVSVHPTEVTARRWVDQRRAAATDVAEPREGEAT